MTNSEELEERIRQLETQLIAMDAAFQAASNVASKAFEMPLLATHELVFSTPWSPRMLDGVIEYDTGSEYRRANVHLNLAPSGLVQRRPGLWRLVVMANRISL